MIIRSQRQLKQKRRNEFQDSPKVISRLKCHPSLLQEYKEPSELNFILRKPSQLKVNLNLKNTQNQDYKHKKSKFYLRPLKSQSFSKKSISRTELSQRKQSRSDKKLLVVKSEINQQNKERSLKDLVFYERKQQNLFKINKIINTFSQNDSTRQQNIEIEQQFYQQVRVLQRFKRLNRMIN